MSGETYFFRDHGQMDLLRLRLLPELLERRRDTKTLRLWSAGCASGEEAYSLAMLTDMVLPEHEGWNVFILGTDIDTSALAKARQGVYHKWSFRLVPPSLQQRYFRSNAHGWVLDERIRRMVTFDAVNLVGEKFPAGDLRDMDLILCRNVFIYFDADSVAAMANKLGAALREDGYLMTGHTELIGHHIRNLHARLFPEGVVYQREEAVRAAAPVDIRIAPPPAVAQPVPQTHQAAVAAPSADDLLAAAREFADRGAYDRAEQSCRQALGLSPLAADPYFLLAQLAQIRGDFDSARELLEKTLYLDPHNVAGYLELSSLCERADNLPRAQTLRRAALGILRALPGDAVVEQYETTAAEMVQWMT
ncbi:MAG: hypothetical protein A2051_06015 [Desulfovibrionales bacterium GWA2_65_9]|nr:MAG: hypothetical protein A2051_06015 [Desulfovibrionales bacterium GWA2_65_9]